MPTLLIVDDEKRIRDIYRRFFLQEGFDVIEASSAMEAKDILVQNKEVDVVLLDINMPEVDGGILSQLINAFHKDVAIVVSSVYPVDEQRRLIPDADDYYDKSQGFDVLMKKVKEVVKRR
ncbi:MAG: hypothetical protein DRN95_08585 [Candidatus Hydrothermarchaeota archaeon]|nr:MAG: hypothetical protein DRN95_08585 [Candidatus Hydrothermarchaeota archaeon]